MRDMRRREYMRDRAERKRMSRGMRRDRGYYPMDDYDYAPERNRERYSRRDRSRYDDEERYMEYEQPRKRMGSYNVDVTRDYADDNYDEEYEHDLKEWIQKLKKKDRFNMSKENVIAKAKEMRVDFKDYTEDEFYATYLMQVSDYPSISNDARVYLSMAKSWLEDDDIAVDPSEKLCIYMYEIVLGDEE